MTIVQWLMVVAIFITMIFELLWAKTKPRCWLGVPLVMWLICSIVYYALVFLHYDMDAHGWGQALRLQGYLTVLLLEGYRYYRSKSHFKSPESVG